MDQVIKEESMIRGATPHAGAVPEDQNLSRAVCAPIDSAPELLEAIERISDRYPGLDLERITNALEIAGRTLSPAAVEAFRRDTLPLLIERIESDPLKRIVTGRDGTGDIVEQGVLLTRIIGASALNGSLEVALPFLLETCPSGSIRLIFGRLVAIAASLGDTRARVFNQVIPDLVRNHPGPFTSNDLFVFQKLCRETRDATADVCAEILPRLNGLYRADFSQLQGLFTLCSAGSRVTPLSVLKAAGLCCDIAERIEGVSYKDVSALLEHSFAIWTRWGAEYQEVIGAEFIKLLDSVRSPRSLPLVCRLLSAGDLDPPRALALYQGTVENGQFKDPSELIEHLERVQRWHPTFPSDCVKPVTELFARAAARGITDTVEKTLSGLIEIFRRPRIGDLMPFLRDSFTRFNDEEIAVLRRELRGIDQRTHDLLISIRSIDSTPLNRLLARAIIGGAEAENVWRAKVPEPVFFGAWNEFKDFEAPPLFNLDETHYFDLRISRTGEEVVRRSQGRLNPKFLTACREQFAPLLPDQQSKLLGSIADLVGRPELAGSHPSKVLPMLVAAAQSGSEKTFGRAVQRALPLLAPATGARLVPYEGSDPSDEQRYVFLETLRALIDDRIVLALKAHGMERPHIDRLKKMAGLDKIVANLHSFERCAVSDVHRVSVLAMKNVIDANHGLLTQSCILDMCGNDIRNPLFQPVRHALDSWAEIIATWYVVSWEVEGRPALVMLGGGPRGSVIKSIDLEQYVAATVASFRRIAREFGYSAGLFTAVGPPSDAALWTDEGRTAQHPDVRRLLVPPQPKLIRLPASSRIALPSGYDKDPCEYLCDLN